MREKIYNYILEHGSITTYQAFVDLWCTRLSEYIRQLRSEHEIDDEWIETTNRYGEKTSYKRYFFA